MLTSAGVRRLPMIIISHTGYGFPRARGGPMFYADQVGLDQVLRRVREFGSNPHGDPAFWTPPPLLDRFGHFAESMGRSRSSCRRSREELSREPCLERAASAIAGGWPIGE
jgi:hypothetical protein